MQEVILCTHISSFSAKTITVLIMRSISLVSQLEFSFSGNVARNALTLGDVDNDGDIELVVGNEDGEMEVFKYNNKWQKIGDFSFITCIGIGDILNINQNCLVVITADGWCHIYYCPPQSKKLENSDIDITDGQVMSSGSTDSDKNIQTPQTDSQNLKLKCIHVQRIPPNTMDVVIGDIDGDGLTEIVFGLTDRVVRSYRWLGKDYKTDHFVSELGNVYNNTGLLSGKPCLLVSQPGGTFMRITSEDPINLSLTDEFEDLNITKTRSEKSMESAVDYQFLGISRMRNQIVHTEILGDLNNPRILIDKHLQETSHDLDNCSKSKPYSLATLDGTIMLVQDEVILWAMAVDHQIFALEKIDITEKNSDDVIASTWDGYTYILDQDRNSVRFQVGESIQAFCSGHYTLTPGASPSTCLVYVTFKNKVRLYYDIPLSEMVTKKFEPICDNQEIQELLKVSDPAFKRKFVEYVMYNLKV
ncbi:KICSTOR complex protein ITFG2 [Agrilus planipennis]|uniref:KICSTOR complex protein ITFG2 n=1 Tax=Agrilus planipennis TaxID=224129 RepID=A0A1W4WCT8_AGRPL|nr:KICSTOR complex protein ITFG2 [Agrilus planipennis]